MTIYDEIREKRKILRSLYGGSMTNRQLMDELGIKSKDTLRRAVQEMRIPVTVVSGRNRYDTDEVARRLVQLRNMA